jgi:hypothetical protein
MGSQNTRMVRFLTVPNLDEPEPKREKYVILEIVLS